MQGIILTMLVLVAISTLAIVLGAGFTIATGIAIIVLMSAFMLGTLALIYLRLIQLD